jgi:hypothetical protein
MEIISITPMAYQNTAIDTAPDSNVIRFEPAPEFLNAHSENDDIEDVDAKVHAARQRAAILRQQAEQAEKEEQLFQEMKEKQERFALGKKTWISRFEESNQILDLELADLKRLVHEISVARDAFARHQEILKGLHPEKWSSADTTADLDAALEAIEDAEEDFKKCHQRIENCRPTGQMPPVASVPSASPQDNPASSLRSESGMQDFFQRSSALGSSRAADREELQLWMRRGAAFTLPLIGALLVGLVLARLLF